MESFILYRGERRKLRVNMTASLNGAEGSNLAVSVHRARGMADVSDAVLGAVPDAAFAVDGDSTFAEVWVDLLEWDEVARLKMHITCDANSGERPVERTMTLLVQ